MFSDFAEAVKWYRLAAEQGYAAAQVNLGVMYANGRGVLKDFAAAVKWYRLAAEQGDAAAQFNLGVRYADGQGVLKDDAEAVKCRLSKATPQHSSTSVCTGWPPTRDKPGSAQFNLGIRYANGEGVLKDSVLAHMWSNIAGANGDEAARELRDNLERDMTRAEISRATELARTCMASNYQDCQP